MKKNKLVLGASISAAISGGSGIVSMAGSFVNPSAIGPWRNGPLRRFAGVSRTAGMRSRRRPSIGPFTK